MASQTDHWQQYDGHAVEGEEIPRKEAFVLLQLLNAAFESAIAQHRRCLGVNAHERLALMHLWASGPMTMSELGERIPLSRAAVTALTDRLERLDYVKRTPDEHDRRRTILSMTQRPSSIVAPIARPFIEDVVALVDDLSEDEWRVVNRFLTGVRDAAQRYANEFRKLDDEELHARLEQARRREA